MTTNHDPMRRRTFSGVLKNQSELSLAVAGMFIAGSLFALLVVTVLPPDRPVEWYVVVATAGTTLLIGCIALVVGDRLTTTWAAWCSGVYLLFIILTLVRASNLNRATVASLLLLMIIAFLGWFLSMLYVRLMGYTALVLFCALIVIRFPNNDGILTAIALLLITVLLTEVFGGFRRNLQRASLIDHLTGTWNRAGFERLIQAEILTHARTDEPLSVIYLDLDHFKTVNDTRGHHAGDMVLRQIADGLAAGLRSRDRVTRIGGDEFVIILPGTAGAEALALAERLQVDVDVCGWSYGISEYHSGETLDQFIGRSDVEMLELKRSRGNLR